MSSLHESVSRRRAAESAEVSCYSHMPGCSALIALLWERERWLLPWSQFVGGRLGGADDDAKLELSFTNYLVVITGEHLSGLLEDIAQSRLGCIRDLPARFRPPSGSRLPFIVRIEVQPVSEAQR